MKAAVVRAFSPLLRRVTVPPFRDRLLATAAADPGPSRLRGRETNPFLEMPGSKGLPLVGNIPAIIKLAKRGENWFNHFQSKYGDICKLRMLGNKWVVVASFPESAEAIFRSEGKYPSRGHFEDNMKWIYRKLNSPMPMFFSKDEEWKQIRSNAAKQVVPRRVGNFVEPLCDITEEFLSHLTTIQDEAGNIQDVSAEINKWTFQGVSYFVYGEKIDIYCGADAAHSEFMEAGLDYIRSLTSIVRALPLYKLFPTKPFKDYTRIVRRLQKAGQHILDRRFEVIKNSIASGVVDENKAVGLLDQWLIEGKFTEEEALSQSYDMLAAGIDTTSITASFLLYELAKHPEIQERLVQEISSVVGDKRHPSWDDLQRMSLVRNCVKETLRLYPPTLTLPRVLQEDVVIQGYRVPAGTAVLVNMSRMSQDEEIFEAAREFRPDRWEKGDSGKISPFSSIPFGFGPRGCYGRRLAELELFILLAKMLPKYQLTTNLKEMKVKVQTLQVPAVPLHINFKHRN